MNVKNFFAKSFFKAIEGITLFRPHDMIIFESHTNFSVNKFSEIGVNFGGIHSKKVLI